MTKLLAYSILGFWAVCFAWFGLVVFKAGLNLLRLVVYVRDNSPETLSRYFFRFSVVPRPLSFVEYIYGEPGNDYPVVLKYKAGFRKWVRRLIWSAIVFAAVHVAFYGYYFLVIAE